MHLIGIRLIMFQASQVLQQAKKDPAHSDASETLACSSGLLSQLIPDPLSFDGNYRALVLACTPLLLSLNHSRARCSIFVEEPLPSHTQLRKQYSLLVGRLRVGARDRPLLTVAIIFRGVVEWLSYLGISEQNITPSPLRESAVEAGRRPMFNSCTLKGAGEVIHVSIGQTIERILRWDSTLYMFHVVRSTAW